MQRLIAVTIRWTAIFGWWSSSITNHSTTQTTYRKRSIPYQDLPTEFNKEPSYGHVGRYIRLALMWQQEIVHARNTPKQPITCEHLRAMQWTNFLINGVAPRLIWQAHSEALVHLAWLSTDIISIVETFYVKIKST